jgi:hypothetical protein
MDVDTDTLGSVRVTASDLDGALRLSLQSDDALSRSMIHDRLPELRRDLVDAGIDFADLDIAQRNDHRESGNRQHAPASTLDAPDSPPPGARPQQMQHVADAHPAGRLDIRL